MGGAWDCATWLASARGTATDVGEVWRGSSWEAADFGEAWVEMERVTELAAEVESNLDGWVRSGAATAEDAELDLPARTDARLGAGGSVVRASGAATADTVCGAESIVGCDAGWSWSFDAETDCDAEVVAPSFFSCGRSAACCCSTVCRLGIRNFFSVRILLPATTAGAGDADTSCFEETSGASAMRAVVLCVVAGSEISFGALLVEG